MINSIGHITRIIVNTSVKTRALWHYENTLKIEKYAHIKKGRWADALWSMREQNKTWEFETGLMSGELNKIGEELTKDIYVELARCHFDNYIEILRLNCRKTKREHTPEEIEHLTELEEDNKEIILKTNKNGRYLNNLGIKLSNHTYEINKYKPLLSY